MGEAIIEALRKASVFLLNDYLERKGLKRASYVSTMERFEREEAIAEAAKASIDELAQGIKEAECLLAELQS